MILSRLKSVAQSRFLKSMSAVALGTLVAQVIAVASLPLLAALFPPEAMGAFSSVLALASLVVTFGSLRVEVLVPLVAWPKQAMRFAQMALLGPLLVVLFIALFGWILPLGSLTFKNSELSLQHLALALPLPVIGIAAMTTFRGLAVRNARFRAIGNAQILRSVVALAISLALGLAGFIELGLGLLIGQALADMSFALWVWFRLPRRFRARLLRPNFGQWRAALRDEWRTVTTLSVTQVMAVLYMRSPVLVILAAFGPIEAGLYALAVRIAQAPSTLVAQAFDDVFRHRAARLVANGQGIRRLMLRGLALTLAVSVLPFCLAILAVPWLVDLVFPASWAGLDFTLMVILGLSILAFNSKAFDKVPILFRANRFIFAWHSARALLELGAAILALQGLIGYESWLIGVALGRSLLYALRLAFVLFLAQRSGANSQVVPKGKA